MTILTPDIDTTQVPNTLPSNDKPVAHIVNPPDNPHISMGHPNMEGSDVVAIAREKGIEIVALCGHKFIPQHKVDDLDACEACFKVAEWIMSEEGE